MIKDIGAKGVYVATNAPIAVGEVITVAVPSSGNEKGIKLREMVQDFLFPGYPFRIAWIPAEEGLGVTVELVDVKAIPDFEK